MGTHGPDPACAVRREDPDVNPSDSQQHQAGFRIAGFLILVSRVGDYSTLWTPHGAGASSGHSGMGPSWWGRSAPLRAVGSR